MEGKNGKESSSSETPNEQRSPQRAEGSTQRQPPPHRRPPPPPPPRPLLPRIQRGRPFLGDRVWGRMPPNMNLHAIPIGGSSGHHASNIGGFATDAATSRKRVREVSQEMVGGRGGGEGRGGPFPFACTMCGKGFLTDKSLFGHMRTHRDRPWKGALPPPVFSREEFADTAGLLNPPVVGGDEQGEQEVDQPQRRRVQYRVPDLNQSPPKEGNGDDDNNNNNNN